MDGLLEVARGKVGPEAIDYNGHFNVVHFRAAFDLGTDGLLAHLRLGPDDYNARTGRTLMVVEEHTRYHAERWGGEGWGVLPKVAGNGAKSLHYVLLLHRLESGGLADSHEALA